MRTPPGSTLPHQGVEDHQELPHARHKSHLLGLAGAQMTCLERPDGAIVAASDQGCHVVVSLPNPCPTDPTAPDAPAAPEGPGGGVPLEGGYAHQSPEFSGAKRAQLCKLCQERWAEHRSDSGNASQESFVLFEGGVVLDEAIEVSVGTREFLFEPADVRFYPPSHSSGVHCAKAVFLGAHHVDDLPPAGEDSLKLPRLGAGKRPGSGTHGLLGETSEDLGIESISLGELSRGTGEVPGLCGVEHGYGDPRCAYHRASRALQRAAGLEEHEGRAQTFEPAEELVKPLPIVGDDERLSCREKRHVQASLLDVDAEVGFSSRTAQGLSPFWARPNLAGAGSGGCSPAQATVRAPAGGGFL
jgi:hypothetical protein